MGNLDRLRLVSSLAAIISGCVVVLGILAAAAFDRAVEPELVKRARLIGSIFRTEIQRTLDLGVPLQAVGLERYVEQTIARFDEVDRITVETAEGAVVADVRAPTASPTLLDRSGLQAAVGIRRTVIALPILSGNDVIGRLTVEVDPLFVETRLRGVFLDVATIALVATLIALELALAVTTASLGKPFDCFGLVVRAQAGGAFLHRIGSSGLGALGRAAARLDDQAADLATRFAALAPAARARIATRGGWRIAEKRPVRLRLSDVNDVRLALFLYSTATEIGSAFLPLYAAQAARPAWLEPQIAAAAPLALYLVGVAALSPLGAPLARRIGPRRVFLACAPATALALAGLAWAETVAEIAFWRGAVAVLYALATIACHQYAIAATTRSGDTRSTGTYVGAIFGGVFCGSAVGGIVAGSFGFEAAFLLGAAIALGAAPLARSAMSGEAGDAAPRRAAGSGDAAGAPLGPRFFVLLLGIAAPTNAATAILVWYLTPIVLAASGYGPADVARVVMLYYLAIVLLGPAVARLADGRLGPSPLVIAGAAIAGGALTTADGESLIGTAAVVLSLGVGHALVRAPQYAVAQRITGGSERGIGLLRLTERAGALLGLAVSAAYVGTTGPGRSLAVLGAIVLTGAAAFAIVSALPERSAEAAPDPVAPGSEPEETGARR